MAVFVIFAIAFAGASLIFLLAKTIVDANDGFSLGPAIGRGIVAGIAEGVEAAAQPGGAFDKGLDGVLRKRADERRQVAGDLGPTSFVWEMAFEFMRTDRTMSAVAARDLAIDTLKDFLRDEKIRFADTGYGWDQSCAITLAHECEIDYWEHSQ
jgi:hypothetical protein